MTFVTPPLAGEYEYPETRWSLSGNYQAGDWGFYTQLDYVGEFEDTPDIDFDGVLDFDSNSSRVECSGTSERTMHSNCNSWQAIRRGATAPFFIECDLTQVNNKCPGLFLLFRHRVA